MKTTFFIISVAVITIGCGQRAGETPENPALLSQVDASKMLLAEIDSLEEIVFTDTFQTDIPSAQKLVSLYQNYVRTFPGNKEATPKVLYKQAAVQRGLGDPLGAIKSYDLILRKYKGNAINPEVAFLIGFTYDKDLNNLELAREAYEYVEAEFEGDLWAEQATQRLETLGMSDEDLVKSFLEKNKTGS